MNKIEIANLDQIIKLGYSQLCLNYSDIRQFTNIPEQNKNFYPFRGRGNMFQKQGFFNGGQTTIWFAYEMEYGHIKIIDNRIPTKVHGEAWSEVFSFQKEDSVHLIERMMKLKAFW